MKQTTEQQLNICYLGIATGAITFCLPLILGSAAMIPVVKLNAFLQGR